MRRRWAIDTNVPVVANGRDDEARPLLPQCREAAVKFLMQFLDNRECVVVDREGEVESEYRNYLNPVGQPGVGDRFYQAVLLNPGLCKRVDLARREDGEYADLPQPVIDSGFDRDDRKFAALARHEGVPVVNAVDSDWIEANELLTENGIRVKFLCGRDAGRWFAT